MKIKNKLLLFILGAVMILQISWSCKRTTLEIPKRNEFYLKNNTYYCYTVKWGCDYDILPSNLYNPTNPNEIPPIMIKTLCPNDSFNLCDFVYKNTKVYIYHINNLNYLELYKYNNFYIGFYKDNTINYKISIYNIDNWQKKGTHFIQEKDKEGNSDLYNSIPYVFCMDSINIININK